MLLSALKTGLKRYGFDTTDPLTQWLNWGMWEVEKAADWPWLIWMENVAVIPGQGVIDPTLGSLPLGRVKKLLFAQQFDTFTGFDVGDPLEEVTIRQWSRDVNGIFTRGTPKLCLVTTLPINVINIQFWPLANVNMNFRVAYKLTEPALVDANPNDAPKYIPDNMEAAIVTRAAAFGLQAENEENRASDALAQYAQLIQTAIPDQEKDIGPRTVQDVMGYGD